MTKSEDNMITNAICNANPATNGDWPGNLSRYMDRGITADLGVDLAYVLVTYNCPVKCSFCDVNANESISSSSLGVEGVEKVAAFLSDAKLRTLIISGGEPFSAFQETRKLLELVPASTVEIITSGHWASTKRKANTVLQKLDAILAATGRRPDFRLRVSIDRWHLESGVVTLETYVNLIQTFVQARIPKATLYLRSIIHDETVQRLAQLLQAELVDLNPPFLKKLRLGEQEILVQFKHLRLANRKNNATLRQEVSFAVDTYIQRLKSQFGGFCPGIVYDGVEVERLEGLNLEIQADGSVRIYGSTPPDNYVNVHTHTFARAREQWFDDIACRMMMEHGVDHLLDLISEVDPNIWHKCLASNDYSQFPSLALGTPALCLYARIRAFQYYLELGLMTIDNVAPDFRELVLLPKTCLVESYQGGFAKFTSLLNATGGGRYEKCY